MSGPLKPEATAEPSIMMRACDAAEEVTNVCNQRRLRRADAGRSADAGPGCTTTGILRASGLGGAITGPTAHGRWSFTTEERDGLLPALRLVLDARPDLRAAVAAVPPAIAADAIGAVVAALLSDDPEAALPHTVFNRLLDGFPG